MRVMSNGHLGYLPSGRPESEALLEDTRNFVYRRELALADAGDSGLLSAADRDQLESEIAAIERASAALRRADPKLETWTDTAVALAHQPRPVWLLIGVLWLSTALVTIGAVFAISALVG
jgi:hypothetical protein